MEPRWRLARTGPESAALIAAGFPVSCGALNDESAYLRVHPLERVPSEVGAFRSRTKPDSRSQGSVESPGQSPPARAHRPLKPTAWSTLGLWLKVLQR
jgi:hypothetical protein